MVTRGNGLELGKVLTSPGAGAAEQGAAFCPHGQSVPAMLVGGSSQQALGHALHIHLLQCQGCPLLLSHSLPSAELQMGQSAWLLVLPMTSMCPSQGTSPGSTVVWGWAGGAAHGMVR